MTNIACHPRVAQLRGYPKPVKAALPKEYVQVTPRTYRSSTKRAASADFREQLAVMIGVKNSTRVNKPSSLAPPLPLKISQSECNYRVPFRNTQYNSTDPIEFQALFPVVESTTEGQSQGHGALSSFSPQNPRTSQNAPRPPRSINYKGLRVSPPPILSTPSYTEQAAFRSPSYSSSTPRGVFPSGFIDDVNGYSSPSPSPPLCQPTRERGGVQTHWENQPDDFMYTDNDSDMDEMDKHPARPGSRMGFYPSHSGYNDDDDAMDDSGPVWADDVDDADLDLEEEREVEEMILEERDISEANPFDFDSDIEEDDEMEMTRELIKILDFQ